MRDDQGGPPRGQVGDQRVIPVGQHALQHVLEALGAGPQLVGQMGIPGIVRLRQRVIVGERRRRHIIGTPPEHELLVPELLPGLRLVLALERAVVALIEAPGPGDWKPEQARCLQRQVSGLDGAGQH